ncbi:MAG TPA: hypothetical protein DEB69_02035 [Candidatus Komeilibacteria bacterium]|nr:hypothetical protein [Candidatus Komeilibacteria bacterium]HBV02182.1 hypothetical protein [Candidatus Komeilibacteria bacterium]HCC73744.1 hypothetical protein [Candidatus Komeilibacteria bacterium]
MRYLINKPNFKELLRCLANIGRYVKYLGGSSYDTFEYRLMYSRLRIAGAELPHFNEKTTRVMETLDKM